MTIGSKGVAGKLPTSSRGPVWVAALAVFFAWPAFSVKCHAQIAPAAATVLETEDFLQTAYCLQFYPACRETNPLLGSHPSTFHLVWYDGIWIASQWLMPKKIRPLWNFLSIAAALDAVINNYLIKYDGVHRVGFRP